MGWVRRLLTLGVSCALLGSPQGASAIDEFTWLNQCMPSAFKICAHISIGTTYDPVANVTQFDIGLSNLQGSIRGRDPGPTGIGYFAFTGLRASNIPSDFDGQWNDWTSFFGNSEGAPYIDRNGVGGIYQQFFSLGGAPAFIYGCDLPVFDHPYSLLNTCGEWMYGGGAVRGRWELTPDVQALLVMWQNPPPEAGFDYGVSHICTTNSIGAKGNDGTCRTTKTVSIPEPGSLALMLFGLMGLVVEARRRTGSARLETTPRKG